jgi:hypothetical protein
MPLFEMHTPNGRLYVRMKAQALAERDIQNYGPIERTDEEIRTRVRYHIEQTERTKPTQDTVVTDDVAAFSKAIQKGYERAYKGLMVGYAGLKEPYCLHAEPRYTTSVNFDDSEYEHPFCGLRELLALLSKEQGHYQAEGQDPLSIIQVSIVDHQNMGPHRYFIAYEVEGDHLIGVIDQFPGCDDVILGLGLPLVEDFEHDEDEVSKV